ncbi:MAG: sigma-70 family RNA polymerase sigma factor [Tissierellia bacterium]|nr:sigma-70 family RNA polymerase sigma factor [Tissierellia bacterium]
MINDQMEKLYIKYYKELYLYAFSLCKNHHLAQDLTSDTFYKAYMSLDDVSYFKYWLFRVCKNLYLDYLKTNREYSSNNIIIENTLSNNETPLDKIIQSEESRHLYNAIINMNESYKDILFLYYFAGFSLKEISKSKNTTEGAAKTMLYRARKRLKREMEGENEL